MGMNLTDASGSGTRIDDFLLARLIAEDARLHFFKIDPLKLDVEMIEAKISRPFARKHRMMPVAVRDGKLIVAVVNPFDTVALDTYHQMVKQEIEIVVSSESDVMGVITEQYGFRASVTKAGRDLGRGAIDSQQPRAVRQAQVGHEIETSDAHIVNAVDFLLQHAYDSRACDIHIEPKRETAMIRFRIDGVLHEIQRVPKLVNLAITSRLKTMCRMDIAEKRRPQDGRIKTERDGKEIELRVSTLPTAFGEKLVMRIFDPDVLLRDLSGLGFYEDELKMFARLDQASARHHPRHRPDRFGQDGHALLGAEVAGVAGDQHHHDRGSDRDGVGRVQSDVGADEDRHHVPVGAAHDPPPGSRHHHGRRDPRRRDCTERGAGGADRTSRLLDAAHERFRDLRHAPHRPRHPAVPHLIDARSARWRSD